MENSEGTNKLSALRQNMIERKYNAYIIPHSDRHDVIFYIT